jgi:hypothetical protein
VYCEWHLFQVNSLSVFGPKKSNASAFFLFIEVVEVGRAVVTKGHSRRKLGRTIRTLEASVEFSSKECTAKKEELKFKEKVKQTEADSPVQNLRRVASEKKDSES